jgi:serine/threonine-protein kinase
MRHALAPRQQGERVDSKGQLSPDGQWFWDGRKWMTTLSPDGQFRWDGGQWAAPRSRVAGVTLGVFRQIPGLHTGTAWKLAVGGFVGLLLIAGISNAVAQPPSTSAGHQIAEVLRSPSPSAEGRPAPPAPSASPSPSPLASPSPSPSPTPPTPPVAVATAAPAPVVAPPPQSPYAAATAAGASAVCADGTWSYSKTRSGTCSSHGGVHWWTGNLGPAGPGAY